VFLRIELFPHDLARAVRFYVDVLRFEIVKDERRAESPYVSLQRGSVKLGLAQREEDDMSPGRRPPTGVEIVMEVPDLSAEYERVRSMWPLEEELTRRPWGLSDFRLLDPAGYYLRITHR
jgi:lactoylglutathione lyase